MSHAKDASEAWALFEKAGDSMNWLRHLYKVNDRARDLYRIDFSYQPWGGFYLPSSPQEPFGYERVKEHNLGVFERRFTAKSVGLLPSILGRLFSHLAERHAFREIQRRASGRVILAVREIGRCQNHNAVLHDPFDETTTQHGRSL